MNTIHHVQFVPLAALADGTLSGLHIHEFRGSAGDGPTLGLSAAIHGDEPTGAHILLELARSLRSTPLKGRLLLLPVANPLAFSTNLRFAPIDRMNLNRVFPGNEGGTYSEQLSALITREFIRKIDVMIDLHSGTDRPTVDYAYIFNDEALSRSLGSKVLYRPADPAVHLSGTSAVTALQYKVRAVVLEIGGGIVDQSPYIRRGVEGVLNAMRHLGMLPGEATARSDQIVVRDIQLVRPRQGGFIETLAPPLGERIAGGAVLGRIVSPYTFEELEVMRNPVADGIMVLSHLTRNLVQPGDFAYMIGNLSDSTP